MNKEIKRFLIVFICLIITWLVCVIAGYKSMQKRSAFYDKYIEKMYGNIQFKGKVMQIHKIRRGGRTHGLICIKLYYTNTDSFYMFYNKIGGPFSFENKMTCLKIKDSIATFPTGFIGNDDSKRTIVILNAKYIEVNMNNNRQIIYIDSVGNKYSEHINYTSSNLIESDMTICN